jgi:hypothetical protein
MEFWQKYYAKMFLLPALTVLMYVLLYLRQFIKRNHGPNEDLDSGDLLSKAKAKARANHIQQTLCLKLRSVLKLLIPMAFSTAVTLYTFLLSNSVSPFNCKAYYNELDGETKYIMARNPAQECYDAIWFSHLRFVITFSVIYGLWFPFVVGYIFYRHRKRIDDHEFQSGYGALVSVYRRTFFFWEFVSMLKRASFVVMTEFLNSRQNSYLIKFAASISTISFFSGLEAIYTPYATKNLNLLSSTYAILSFSF